MKPGKRLIATVQCVSISFHPTNNSITFFILVGRSSAGVTKILQIQMRQTAKTPRMPPRVFSLVDIQLSQEGRLKTMKEVLSALTFGRGAFKTKASKHRHVPYRNSKLTRLFQVSSSASLFGFSRN